MLTAQLPRLFIFQVKAEALLSLSALRIRQVHRVRPRKATSMAGHLLQLLQQFILLPLEDSSLQLDSTQISAGVAFTALRSYSTCRDTIRSPWLDESLETHLPKPSVVCSTVLLPNFSIIPIFLVVKFAH